MNLCEITREPIADYHSRDCLSHSKLETFRDPDRGRERFHGLYISKTIPHEVATSAMGFGQALDSLVLERKRVFKPHPATYMGKDGNTKQMVEKPWRWGATFTDAWAEENKDYIILSPDRNDPESAPNVDACNDAVWANPIAAALLSKGEPQVSFRYNFGPFKVQVRPDWWNKDGVTLPDGTVIGPYIVDLKSAADEAQFQANRKRFGYDRQNALYSEIVRMVLADLSGTPLEEMPEIPFFFAVVYKDAPVQCRIRVLDRQDLEDAKAQNRKDIAAIKECFKTGNWSSAPAVIETLPSLDWKRAKDTERGAYQPEAAIQTAA